MKAITVVVSDLAHERLEAAGRELDRPIDDLAACAVEEAALEWSKGRPSAVTKAKDR